MNTSRSTSALRRGPGPSFEAKFKELERETSSENWDDEGGHKIAADRFAFVLKVYALARQELRGLPEPHPSASGDGSIHLRWVRGACVFDAEFAASGRVLWAYRSATGVEHGSTGLQAELITRLRDAFA
jgi:hypothetical protein